MASLSQLGAILTSYTEAAVTALEEAGRPVDRTVATAPGVNPAWDSSCGQLYGRLVSVQPVGEPRPGAGCGPTFWVATLGLSVTRCVSTPTVAGQRVALPGAALVAADGAGLLDDLAVLERVITCHAETRSLSIGQPLPEQGGVAGVDFLFTVRLEACGCPQG